MIKTHLFGRMLTCISFFMVVFLSGCRGQELLNQVPGRYSGYVLETQAGPDAQASFQKPVTALITSESRTSLTLKIESDPKVLDKDSNKTSERMSWQINLQAYRGPRLNLTSETLFSGPRTLFQEAEQPGCLATDDTETTPELRFCFDGSKLSISQQINNKSTRLFTLNRMAPDSGESVLPPLETPAPYSLEELRKRAIEQSFDSRAEFERVLQARLAARGAYLNLAPHFTLNTILGFLTFSWMSIIKSAGDLAPFLLPTRWFRIREAKFQSQADYKGWLVMRADAGCLTEGLMYSVLRDRKSVTVLGQTRAQTVKLRDEIKLREELGIERPDASLVLSAVIGSVDNALLMLNEGIRAEMSATAQAAGFMNPDAISEIKAPETLTIVGAQKLDKEPLKIPVIAKSLELQQMDSLINVAQVNRRERYFSWMDPSGGEGALGFGFFDYLRVGQSKVRELFDRRAELQSTLLQKLSNSVGEINMAVDLYQLSTNLSDLHRRRIARMNQDLALGTTISLYEMSSALQEQMRADLAVINAEYSYYTSLGKLNRLLFQNGYEPTEAALAPAPFAVAL